MEKIDKRSKEYRDSKLGEVSNLDRIRAEAFACYYARFHQPVPTGYDKEPVSEFKVKSQNKYSVESMLYHPTAGLIFEAVNKRGELEEDIIPAANIIYVRV